MTPMDIDALQIVLNNNVIMSALRGVFADTLSRSLPAIDKDISNEVIGEKYRAYHDCTNIVWNAFQTLESYKKVSEEKKIDDLHI